MDTIRGIWFAAVLLAAGVALLILGDLTGRVVGAGVLVVCLLFLIRNDYVTRIRDLLGPR